MISTSGIGTAELRARERRALNEVTLDERLARAPEEPTAFACECGELSCKAHVRLTPGQFAAFRQDFRGFVVAAGHELGDRARRFS
jgi:hypothetical protein